MTKEQFITRFTELTAAQAASNPDYASFRDEVLQDYDALNQANVSLEAVRQEHQALQNNYSSLQSAYTRLYMTLPIPAPNPNPDPTPNPNPDPTPNPNPNPNPQPTTPTTDDIIKQMTSNQQEGE